MDDEGQHYGTQAKSGRKAGPGWVREGELRLEPTLDPLWIQKANLVLLRRELTWKWGVPDLTSGQYRARWERKCSKGSARALPGSRPSSCPMAMAGWLEGVKPAPELGEEAEPGPPEPIFLDTRDPQVSP